MKIINLHKLALYLLIYVYVCITKWASAIHEKWMGRCPVTRVSVIAESVQRNGNTLNTPGIWEVRIHSGALVASLCLDDLFHSVKYWIHVEKQSAPLLLLRVSGRLSKYKTAILRSDTEVKVIFLPFSSFTGSSAYPSTRCTGRYSQ